MTAKDVILTINNDDFSKDELVSILGLIDSKLKPLTISEKARRENKTPKGIKNSKRYPKISFGNAVFVVDGIRFNEFPF